MIKLNMKFSAGLLMSLAFTAGAAQVAAAQSSQNDFFTGGLPNQQVPAQGYTSPQSGNGQGSSSSSSSSSSSPASPTNSPSGSPSSLVPAPTGNGATPTDFTQDEKRMQKKTKAMVSHVKGLIEKGDRMMKDGQAHHDDKMYKKGKILKDIGEKRSAELKASAQAAEAAKLEKDKAKADGT